ncbi:MAG: delta-aminolevulinic acid dehydratase [Cenarchaeum symbiont of Oopsacas minuta]|nr:delta-aminolevulinic acid dehydratase [Cenarchaeum symbiont of Oopsacas minuta]
MRDLVRESSLSPTDLVLPMFVQDGIDSPVDIKSMPEMRRLPIKDIAAEASSAADLGIPAIMLFGIPTTKDDIGSAAYEDKGAIQQAISSIRSVLGEKIVVMADVCLCQYTLSGHCGLEKNGKIDNDSSLTTLARIAVSQADAGVNVVSPSAMMDGQVATIRSALDDAGHEDVAIMSHSAKHRSSFYSPFRNAAECAPKFGDRKTYQVPYTNGREAISELQADYDEGVDMLMIKPALAYLDLIAEAKRRFTTPIAAYSVSGEFALVKAASMQGWVNEDEITHEILSSIKRAGADIIMTYFAKQVAQKLAEYR